MGKLISKQMSVFIRFGYMGKLISKQFQNGETNFKTNFNFKMGKLISISKWVN